MGKSSIKKNFLRTSVVAAALAGAVGSAGAAQWQGTWDPWFGSPFTDLYFSGSALFDTGSCEADNPTAYPGDGSVWLPSQCAGMRIVTATMLLTNFDPTSPTNSGTPLTTANSTPFIVQNQDVNWMRIESGSLVGVYSSWITLGKANQPFTSIPLAGGGDQPIFGMQFRYEQEGTDWVTNTYLGYKYTNLVNFDCVGGTMDTLNNYCGSKAALTTITPVPEPSTYALMGLGLAAVAAMRRRSIRKQGQA